MILLLIVYLVYLIYASTEAMHMLQQNLYNENNRYLKWIRKNITKAFSIFDLVPIIIFVVILFVNDKETIDFLLIGSMFIYLFNFYREIQKNKANQNKIPLKGTGRIKRLFLTNFVLHGVVVFFTYKFSLNHDYKMEGIFLIILALMMFFRYIVIYISNILNAPLNSIIYYYYYNKAKKKLKENSNLQVVGVTGSYGKTSCKNILQEILSSKYITRATPKNYNTPYGLMLTINNNLDKFDEILIAEMGAYRPGRIKNLCDFVEPKYGILTVIGEAHLETFKSRENIQKTKFELIESLPSDGVAILNIDDPYQVKYNLRNKVKVKWIGIDNNKADVYATNIKCSSKGMSFTCHIKDKDSIQLETRLLGEYNIYNILAAVALAIEMNVDIEDIKSSVHALRSTEHRLELKKVGKIFMLDDAYNSNPVGANGALDVLSSMPGTKVVVTPGMVELGKKEAEENYKLGKKISEVCDYVILVGKKKTVDIQKALKDSKFDNDKIFIINKVMDAYQICEALKENNKDIYCLFENDLPDIYMEGEKKK